MKDISLKIWDSVNEEMLDNLDPYAVGVYLHDENYEKLLYIGLGDRDGNPIYEGDILEIDADGEVSRHVVVWGNSDTCVYPAFYLTPRFGSDANCISTLYEVYGKESVKLLGNKYENPELLKTNNKETG